MSLQTGENSFVAVPEHIEIARAGAEALNAWRKEHPDERLDLSGADLRGADLSEADLRAANLEGVTGHGLIAEAADFRRAELGEADLRAANFQNADLRAAYLGGVDLRVACLANADLRRADLHQADLRRADLTEASFQDGFLPDARLGESRLINTNFTRANLYGVDFENALASGVFWNDVDLSEAKNLDTIKHLGPSSIGIDTVYESRSELPAEFLRGSGVNESFITNASLLASQALRFHPVLIVYAEEDKAQAEWLEEALQKRGVRCWTDAVSDESGSPEEFYRHRRGQKVVFLLSRNWFARESALGSLKTAQMLEERLSGEQGLTTRNWYVVDFDGVLRSGENAEIAEPLKERKVGEFSPEFSQNGRFEQQLENVLGTLTAQAGTGDQATLVDQALTQLRQLIGHTDRLQEGYRRLRHNDGAKNVWFDYRGKQRRSYHIRQLVPGQSMEWDTAPVVFERGESFCYFCFAAAMGAQNRPPGQGFTLLVNGEPTVPFNLARDERAWHSPDHSVTLLYAPHWLSRDDSSGFFYVAILKDRLKSGHPCRLGVQVRGKDSPRWFALFPEKQAVLCQAEMALGKAE